MSIVKRLEYRTQNNLFVVTICTDDGKIEYQINKEYIDNSNRMTYTPTEKEIQELIGLVVLDIWCSISYSHRTKDSDICIEIRVVEINDKVILFTAPIKYITGLEQIVNIKNWS